MKAIPVVDLFAGPGGLSEGFSAFRISDADEPFKVVLSIEKEFFAHRTLTLRSFYRQFEPGRIPDDYYEFLRNPNQPETDRIKRLFEVWPDEAERARETALLEELGRDNVKSIRERITKVIGRREDFVLIGGPPCQAYSVIGRSRNTGNSNYNGAEDKRQRLYVEYLQVLADHHPAAFIMENVKGLLSATLENQRIFERILEDLESPCEAVIREGRDIADQRRRIHYNLFSIGNGIIGNSEDLRRFVVRMENHGIPQSRHRLIIVGVRSDLGNVRISSLNESDQIPIERVISDLPPIRSGISGELDELGKWRNKIREIRSCNFMDYLSDEVDQGVKKVISSTIKIISSQDLPRGSGFISCYPETNYRPEWYNDIRIGEYVIMLQKDI